MATVQIVMDSMSKSGDRAGSLLNPVTWAGGANSRVAINMTGRRFVHPAIVAGCLRHEEKNSRLLSYLMGNTGQAVNYFDLTDLKRQTVIDAFSPFGMYVNQGSQRKGFEVLPTLQDPW